MDEQFAKGLEGIVVAESELSNINGETGDLLYRGYDIEDLATGASYEEVLYLLGKGALPPPDGLGEFSDGMASGSPVEGRVRAGLSTLADMGEQPWAAPRTGCWMPAATDPAPPATPGDGGAARRKGRRILAQIPTLLAAYDRLRRGEEPVEPDETRSYAGNFLYMLTGDEPGAVAEETFDMALTLHADHGLNASTFTTVVIASTFADVYSSVTGGIGALAGPLHGGANQDVMEALFDLDESGMTAREWVEDTVDRGSRVPGWGHRVYSVTDPRAAILRSKLEDLAAASGETRWLEYTTTITEYLTEEQHLPEQGVAPNVDFYSGSVYHQLGIPIDMYTPIFAMARAGGWLAHILEYQTNNRLIRPRGRYVGPEDETFIPLEDR